MLLIFKYKIMKTLVKLLTMLLFITAFVACSDDDDNPPIVINDVMVVYNSDSGMFSSINLMDGTLTPLGTITYNEEILTGLRDIVYNPLNGTVYASSRSSSSLNNGAIFSVNPSTLEATMLNDNADDDWYAVPGIEMSDGKIIGTVYWDEFDNNVNLDYGEGLIWLNLDGTVFDYKPLLFNGEDLSLYEGMAIEYGSSTNQILVTRYDEVIISDLNGVVSQIIELEGINFPDEESLDGIRTLETSRDGILYGIDRYSHFGSINLADATFTYIATLSPEDDIHVALSLIPENVFD